MRRISVLLVFTLFTLIVYAEDKKKQTTQKKECTLCASIQTNNDKQQFLITRFQHNAVFLNLLARRRGHILIVPYKHVKDLEALSTEARHELMQILCALPNLFEETLGSCGTNIGMNINFTPTMNKPKLDHFHVHALPRYKKGRRGHRHPSYIQLISKIMVIDWDQKRLYAELKPAFDKLQKRLYPKKISSKKKSIKKIESFSPFMSWTDQQKGSHQFCKHRSSQFSILYAPHREIYEYGKQDTANYVNSCVFCQKMAHEDSTDNFILERFTYNTVILNLFPYTHGHLLIIPNAHIDNTDKISTEAQQELMNIVTAIPKILETVLGASGISMGLNIGQNSGASKPRHIHVHAVPRFDNELQSYENLLKQTEIASLNLHALQDKLKPAFKKLKRQLEN